MYAFLRGILAELTSHHVVVDVGGMGFRLHVPVSHLSKLPHLGQQVTLHTSWVVRENAQSLYGFADAPSRDLFEKLIGFSGIGPKTGLAILGAFTPQTLQSAVDAGDVHSLTKVPGIGKKTAERLLVELRGKLDFAPAPQGKVADACQALINLGYSRLEADRALKKALQTLTEDAQLGELIAAALK